MVKPSPAKKRLVIAVIGDLVASRTIFQRDRVQTRLRDTITAINRTGRPASPFVMSAGDEIEAIYTDGISVFRDLLTVFSTLHPQRIRFSVALGTLSTRIDTANPWVVDGPAFHLARAGLIALKNSTDLIRIVAEPPVDVLLENDAARILLHHVSQWKQVRWDVFRQLALGTPKIEIATRLNISVPSVYKNIRSGAVELIRDLANDIGRALARKIHG